MDNNSGGESRAALKRKKKLKRKKRKQQHQPLVAPAPSTKKKKKQKQQPGPPPPPVESSNDALQIVQGEDVAPDAINNAMKPRTQEDGDARGRRLLRALLAPVGARCFYEETFERRGLLVRGRGSNYLSGWCSSEDVFRALEQPATSGVDVDVTRYDPSSEKRKTLSDGIVMAEWARQQLDQGATIRLRQPQDRLTNVQALCRALEGEFGSTVGANAYLTAKDGAQGFAAHWDDVDVFILQLEGRKRWRVGACADDVYRLPRVSSEDFDEEALRRLCPHLSEIVLEPGDVLYLPRGFIHSAVTEGLQNSLHLTLSCHRANSWADLLEAALPNALSEAIASDPKMRESLPRDCLHYMGVAHSLDSSDDEIDESDDDDASLMEVAAVRYDPEIPRSRSLQKKRRQRFAERCAGHCKDILARLLTNLDATCDDRSVAFVAERLPPLAPEKGDPSTITATTRVHCVERRDARLVPGEAGVLLYHALDNATSHRGRPVACLEFEEEDAPALEALLASHAARPVLVRDLPHSSDDDRIAVASSLVAEGLLVVSASGLAEASSSSDDDG
jgi:lysine-specific demethylase/histidyl-hydroxylase NO66